ncbi:MAG: glycyl-tRNA synthetase, partial [Paraglaciecola sp.]
MAKIDEKATIKNIASHCKEYGFIYPSSDIYEGLGAAYDYGPNGVLLKNNLKDYWWKSMVQMNDNIVGIDASIFMHPTTWKASGHVDAFNDPMVDNKDSKKRYRADVLIEEQIAKIQNKIDKELAKAAKRFGETFDKEQYLTTNPRVVGYQEQISSIEQRMKSSIEEGDLDALKQLIVDLEIADPVSGSKNWTDVRQFNLMFSTEMGSVADGTNKIYLRPETAQGIFVNFLNVQKTSRMKPPFGIAQIGKA